MATIGGNNLTIGDIVRRSKPDGTLAIIGEVLSQNNGMADDVRWVEADLPQGHMSTVRTSLPTFSTINPNGTATPTKSTTAQVMEPVEYITAMSDVHDLVLRYGGDISSKRASEAVAFAEGGKQTIADRLVNGNGATTPGQINGILTRYDSTSDTHGRNVILGGGSGSDMMSIIMCEWGPGKVYGIYPKGSKGGLEINDWGKRISEPSSTTRQVMYTEEWLWGFGLAVDDWRSVVRIANIDKSLLVAGTGADLFDKLIQGAHCLPQGAGNGRAIYMNRTTRMMLDIQARNDVQAGAGLKFENVGGMMVETFRGIPINLEDKLTESESAIS